MGASDESKDEDEDERAGERITRTAMRIVRLDADSEIKKSKDSTEWEAGPVCGCAKISEFAVRVLLDSLMFESCVYTLETERERRSGQQVSRLQGQGRY